MSSITINLGDAFLIDTPPNKQHLYIAIAQISESKYLFVNTTTRRPRSETACIITPGPDVPKFIKVESVIAYQFACELDASDLAKLITPNSPIPKETFSATLLEQIQQGALVSKRLPNKYKDVIKTYLGIS